MSLDTTPRPLSTKVKWLNTYVAFMFYYPWVLAQSGEIIKK